MSTATMGTATESRPATDAPARAMDIANTAERRVRTLAPTVFCPAKTVDQCVERHLAGQSS